MRRRDGDRFRPSSDLTAGWLAGWSPPPPVGTARYHPPCRDHPEVPSTRPVPKPQPGDGCPGFNVEVGRCSAFLDPVSPFYPSRFSTLTTATIGHQVRHDQGGNEQEQAEDEE